MRDGLVIPFNDEFLVITNDNSGGIGNKEKDAVHAPYEMVSYYAFRVAVMECMSLEATPVSAIINNYCGDKEWHALVRGVEMGQRELEIGELAITGSSETNIPMVQSVVGVTVVGRKRKNTLPLIRPELKFAVIGKPLVGEEVKDHPEWVAPLTLFQWVCNQKSVAGVIPVGSKGIRYELGQLLGQDILEDRLHVELDVHKSGGPSTCFLVAYEQELHEEVKSKASLHFHPIDLAVY